jgi:hypothetical protein
LGSVRVPLEAALGEARLTLSIPGWPEGSVQAKEFTFTIAEESWLSWSLRHAAVAGLLLACGLLLWWRKRWLES